MKLEKHIALAIDAFDRNSKEEALMHATIAIDATARKLFSKKQASRNDYKLCIRQYWWIIERFIGEGFNLVDTKFTYLLLLNGNEKPILNPDLADVIYHIFRCCSAHGDEIPKNFQLLPYQDGLYTWKIDRENNGLQMPETIIWALLAISVFCKANSDIKTHGEYRLTWGNKDIGVTEFLLRNYWGKEDELKQFFSNRPTTRVKLDV